MAHDVFISYSSKDKPVADAVCATLEGQKIRCWVAPRDVQPGLPYGEAIVDAIQGSRILVLVFSARANDSSQVMREVERAVSKGIPIIPLRIEAVRPSKSLEYFISAPHWLDALTPPLRKHLDLLGETIQLLLSQIGQRTDAPGAGPTAPVAAAVPRAGRQERRTTPPAAGARSVKPAVTRRRLRYLALAAVIVGLLCAVVGVAALVLSSPGTDTGRRAIMSTAPNTGIPTGKTLPLQGTVRATERSGNSLETKKAEPPSSKEPYVNSIGMKFAWIPPGKFRMGGDKSVREKPVHFVTITKGFYMGVYPVTQKQWQEVMGNSPSNFKGDDSCPLEGVSWDDCQKFCEKVRQDGKPYRLPYEAEWEYACRAGTTTDYYTGDGEDALKRAGWYLGNSDGKTHPVGKLDSNSWGLCDMHDNVWQWCQDGYAPYPTDDVEDQKGPDNSNSRVLRGGSWINNPEDCRAAGRHWGAPGIRNDYAGCRVCFPLD